MNPLLAETAKRADRYVSGVRDRRVAPDLHGIAGLEQLGGALNDEPADPVAVLAQLDDFGSPGTMATTGGRYFGFVNGALLPAALAANWLAGAWDQNGGLQVMSPVAAKLEEVALSWLLDVLKLPAECAAGFVTGATMANFTCLAAARHALLARSGWNVEEDGLYGAPALRVVVGAEVHVSLLKALALLGLGRSRVIRVEADGQGRMQARQLPPLDAQTIVCLQSGNVNTGAFDEAEPICARARDAGAWVHVDGAFGLWAAAAPRRAHLAAGLSLADSWATDCHKWLNVPYDSGLAFVKNGEALRAAMAVSAAYLHASSSRQPCFFTPEASRRARGIEVWAALRSLGRNGLAAMIERTCALASRFAQTLAAAGFEILNDVVLNQVLVSFGDGTQTQQVIARVQEEGVCWCGGTVWQGRTAMRISVSSWATTEEDVDRSTNAILRAAKHFEANLDYTQ